MYLISLFCKFIFLPNLLNWTIFLKYFFSSTLGTPMAWTLDLSKLTHRSLMVCSFFLSVIFVFSLVWVIFIDLYLLILFFFFLSSPSYYWTYPVVFNFNILCIYPVFVLSLYKILLYLSVSNFPFDSFS